MYGAVRERARTSTLITGLSVSVLATVLVGYALANGFGASIVRMIETPITFTPLIEEVVPADKPTETTSLDDTRVSLEIPAPIPPDIPFEVRKDVITGPTTEILPPRDPVAPTGNTVTPKPVRTWPALLTRDPPPYPAAELRKQNEGDTALEVCVAASGRVTSASIAASSGHPVLDNAALKWVRNARFTPGKMDGVAQAMCGHSVTYEWNLADARK